jgi:hypothetical protein
VWVAACRFDPIGEKGSIPLLTLTSKHYHHSIHALTSTTKTTIKDIVISNSDNNFWTVLEQTRINPKRVATKPLVISELMKLFFPHAVRVYNTVQCTHNGV